MRLVVLSAVLALAAPGPLRADGEKGFDPKRVAALIEQLGDPHFPTREAAEQALVAAGEPVLPAVRAAVAATDQTEVLVRGERVVLGILRGLRTSKACGLRLCVVEAGEFEMGSGGPGGRPDEKAHTVRLHRQFLIGKHEVTQAEYKAVTATNPSFFSADGGGAKKVEGLKTDRFPVEQVTWFDAVAFCNRLSQADGHPPYYELTDAKSEDGAVVAAAVKVLGGAGFRLPTEAEWEYAARGGTTTAYSFGPAARDGAGNFKMVVSVGYGGSEERPSLGRTGTVGSYKVNPFGLHDVHGNAAEWCHDWYAKDYYDKSPADDPTGPDRGDHKAVRGGSWMTFDANCRSAARFYLAPGERKEYVGFRVARTP